MFKGNLNLKCHPPIFKSELKELEEGTHPSCYSQASPGPEFTQILGASINTIYSPAPGNQSHRLSSCPEEPPNFIGLCPCRFSPLIINTHLTLLTPTRFGRNPERRSFNSFAPFILSKRIIATTLSERELDLRTTVLCPLRLGNRLPQNPLGISARASWHTQAFVAASWWKNVVIHGIEPSETPTAH